MRYLSNPQGVNLYILMVKGKRIGYHRRLEDAKKEALHMQSRYKNRIYILKVLGHITRQ